MLMLLQLSFTPLAEADDLGEPPLPWLPKFLGQAGPAVLHVEPSKAQHTALPAQPSPAQHVKLMRLQPLK